MINVEEIINQIKTGGATAGRVIIEGMGPDQLRAVQARLRKETNTFFGKTITSYIPGRQFPAISITGHSCDLNCLHCQDKYLHGMIPVTTPRGLEEELQKIHDSGGTGALISGGSSRDGIVPMERFYPVLKKVKKETELSLNVHTGLIGRRDAERLFDTGIDKISLDLIGDDRTAREIYGLDRGVRDYKNVLSGLMNAGFTAEHIIPHVCIGLHWGRVMGEYNVLEYISGLHPRLIVFIVIIPPKANDAFAMVPPEDVGRVISTARIIYPETELSLGCMRPGGLIRFQYDKQAFMSGINRIALPTSPLKKLLELEGFLLKLEENCCAIG
ncbi:MAG: radical SAM protein [Promethearchaeota archaeon]